MVVVEEDAASGDPTAMGLQKQLSVYSIVVLLHLTADINRSPESAVPAQRCFIVWSASCCMSMFF